MEQKVGFIGLGIMGKPMSLNLMKAGYSLTVFDLNQESVNAVVNKGAIAASSPKEVAERSDVIITMLPASKHVEQVVLAENGILEGAKEGSVIIDMSSITPDVSRALADQTAKQGVECLMHPSVGESQKQSTVHLPSWLAGRGSF